MKRCTKCGVDRPLTEYYSGPRKITRSACIPCYRASEKAYGKRRRAAFTEEELAKRAADVALWRKNNREKARNYRLLRDYGIGIEDYRAMLERQGGVCAICQIIKDENYSLVVDHCHTTGKVRGLLCNPCNRMLGFARDRRETLARAAEYLVRQ